MHILQSKFMQDLCVMCMISYIEEVLVCCDDLQPVESSSVL